MEMSSVTAGLPVLEMSAPEFFWTHIGKVESAGSNCLRFYCCILKGNAYETVFTCVIPIPEMIAAGKHGANIASDFMLSMNIPGRH
jgi:hypothetical protein